MIKQKRRYQINFKIFEAWQIPIIFVTHSNYEAQQMAHEIITIEDCIQI